MTKTTLNKFDCIVLCIPITYLKIHQCKPTYTKATFV